MNLEDYEKLDPRCTVSHNGVEIVYATPTTAAKWRVDTLFEKEPITIEWLARIKPGEILVDVGANVGMYTIWAARTAGAMVHAFEPEALNYALLNRNIHYNRVSDKVRAYCIALSDHSGLGELHVSRFLAGGSSNQLDEKVDAYLRPAEPQFTQGCVTATLDSVIESGKVPVPQYIKIDVDAFEPNVVRGAAAALRSGQVRSLIIEVNPALPEHVAMVKQLNAQGYRHDPEQVRRATRTSGPFTGCAEYVFTR